ncbi:unnamed protein product [Nyctereutes procyonoides]|uniref:Biogenesis of lysosome-related organelles complex 1 subunit 1 n=1 Tax=Nyctereutes procyonoides TaxID=34880 RepID=A0A811Y2X7_NYCPR|nr:unnamed protein product [Nyctereutes procyonoides]
MFSHLLAKQRERKKLQEKRRREAIPAATCLPEALLHHLSVGVAQASMNQRKLDHEAKTLQASGSGWWRTSIRHSRKSGMWTCGNRRIELDMRTIATALEYGYKGQLQAIPS